MRTVAVLSLLALLPGALAHRALAGRKMGSDDAAESDPTDPGPVSPPTVLLVSPGNLTTCQAVQITWDYDPRSLPASTLINIYITNVGINQGPPPPTSSSTTSSSTTATISSTTNTGTFGSSTFPSTTPTPHVRARRSQNNITQTFATGIALADTDGSRTFQWDAVDVPQGWYEICGTPYNGDNATFGSSPRFYVATGDTTCLFASGSSSSSSSSSSAAAVAGTGTPISTVAHKSAAAPIIGAVVGVLAGLALLVGVFFLWAEHRRRRSGAPRRSSGAAAHYGLGSHDSRAPRASSSQHTLPPARLAARAAAASAPTLEGEDDEDGSWDEKPTPTSDHRQSMASGISAYISSGARARANSAAGVEGYPLGVLPRTHSQPVAAGAAVARAPSGTRRTPRKPVPAYDPRELASAGDAGDDETVVGGSVPDGGKDLGIKLANGSTGQLHFLIPDLPPPAR